MPPLELLLERPGKGYTIWDYRLIKALKINESYMVNGFPVEWEESPDKVVFEVKKDIIRSAKALEEAQARDQKAREKNKGAEIHGQRYYVVPKLRPGVEKFPTRAEWSQKRAGLAPDVKTPETEDLIRRQKESEERSREAVRNNPALQAIVDKALKKG